MAYPCCCLDLGLETLPLTSEPSVSTTSRVDITSAVRTTLFICKQHPHLVLSFFSSSRCQVSTTSITSASITSAIITTTSITSAIRTTTCVCKEHLHLVQHSVEGFMRHVYIFIHSFTTSITSAIRTTLCICKEHLHLALHSVARPHSCEWLQQQGPAGHGILLYLPLRPPPLLSAPHYSLFDDSSEQNKISRFNDAKSAK